MNFRLSKRSLSLLLFGILCTIIVLLYLKRIARSDFIVFTNSIGNSRLQIYIVDGSGNNKYQITNNERSNYAPAISPDGRYIAFVSAPIDQPGVPIADIYLMDIGTKQLAQLTNLVSSSLTLDKPIWSSDGQRIAFIQTDASQNKSLISIIDIDGANLITNAIEGTVGHLAWSPDNNKILFDTTYSGRWLDYFGKFPEYYNIYIWDINNLQNTRIVDGRKSIFGKYPEWSPSGDHIAYTAWKVGDTNTTQIYIANADGSNPVRITQPEDQPEYYKLDPIWSPDGTQVVFRASRNLGQGSDNDCLLILLANDSDCSIPLYLVNRDGSGLTQLVSEGANILPSWSADGKEIMFLSIRQQKFAAQILVVDVDSYTTRLISNEWIAPNMKYGPLWGEF